MAWGAPLLLGLLALAAIACLGLLFLAATERGVAWGASAVFVVGWGLLVLVPLVWGAFGRDAGDWTDAVGAYDFAGAMPFHLALGVAALVLLLRTRKTAEGRRRGRMPASIIVGSVALGWLGWTGWLVCMELEFDRLVGQIVVTTTILSACSLLAVVVIERVRTGRNTPVGAVMGVWSGLAASTACCVFLEPLAAAITGVVVGAVAGAAATSRRGIRSASLTAMIAVANLSGGGVGLLMVGLLDSGRGFFYTGAPTLPIAQLSEMAGAGLLATAVAVSLALIAIRPKSVKAPTER